MEKQEDISARPTRKISQERIEKNRKKREQIIPDNFLKDGI